MKLISVTLKFLISLMIIFCAVAIATTQERQKPAPSPGPSPLPKQLTVEAPALPAANPADVASIDTIIADVYDVISGTSRKEARLGPHALAVLRPALV